MFLIPQSSQKNSHPWLLCKSMLLSASNTNRRTLSGIQYPTESILIAYKPIHRSRHAASSYKNERRQRGACVRMCGWGQICGKIGNWQLLLTIAIPFRYFASKMDACNGPIKFHLTFHIPSSQQFTAHSLQLSAHWKQSILGYYDRQSIITIYFFL